MNDESLDRDLKKAFARGTASRCPGEDALVRFYRGDLSESDSEAIREHLATCGACVELARDARAFVAAMSGADVTAMRGANVAVLPMSRSNRWLAAAAGLAAAAILGIWLARSSPSPVAPTPETGAETPAPAAPRSWKDLPVAVAAYAPEDELLFRSDAPAGSRGFAEAMAPYARGDYAAAEVALARFLVTHPRDARASFYRGVSLLLLGRPEEAVPLLKAAAESGPSPEGARWYLGLAQLKSGNEGAALRELDAVAGAEGAHGPEAAQLAKEVRSGLDARPR